MSNRTGALPFTDLWEALGASERRRIVSLLSTHADTAVDVDTLSGGIESPSAGVSLRHAHLPRLAALGVVDWNRDRRRVSRGPHFEAAARLVDRFDQCQDAYLDRAAVVSEAGDPQSD